MSELLRTEFAGGPVTTANFTGWRKSERSNESNCLIVSAPEGDFIGVGDSKEGPGAPVLVFSTAAVANFVGSIKQNTLQPLPQ